MKKLCSYVTSCLLSALCLLCFGCNGKIEELKKVETYEITQNNNKESTVFYGQLRADTKIDLSFRIAGKVEKIFVSEGQAVKKGELIAQLDSNLYFIKEKKAHYALLDAIVQYENDKSYFNRIKKLHKAGGISDNDMDNARTKMESGHYKIKIAQQEFDYATQELDYRRIYAPTDGIILTKSISDDEYVDSGTTIVQMQEKDDICAYVYVGQNLINQIKKNEIAQIKVNAIEDEIFIGYVKETRPTTIEDGSYRVKIEPLKKDDRFKDLMSASVEMQIENSASGKILIPISSILKREGENYVYILSDFKEEKALIKTQKVKIGKIIENDIEILCGLKNKDIIITKGIDNIKENMWVRYR